jgi:hypothetical protein
MISSLERRFDIPAFAFTLWVATLDPIPFEALVCRPRMRQVITIVEQFDDKTLLGESGDDQGHAYAVTHCPQAGLFVLHCVSTDAA